jgi:hypothetical protein
MIFLLIKPFFEYNFDGRYGVFVDFFKICDYYFCSDNGIIYKTVYSKKTIVKLVIGDSDKLYLRKI